MASVSLRQRYHDAVQRFGVSMRNKLKRNSHKGDWAGTPILRLYQLLRVELEELADEVAAHDRGDPDAARRLYWEAVDVANFAMMMADTAERIIQNGQDRTVEHFVTVPRRVPGGHPVEPDREDGCEVEA